MNVKNAIIKTKVENELYELWMKTGAENVYVDDTTTLATKLADIISILGNKANSSDVTSQISTAIDGLIDGAPETYDTLKEIASYITEHEDVVTALNNAIGNKVDKVEGKGLSANDFTDILLTKLNGIAEGAEVNQNAFSKVKVGDTIIESLEKTGTFNVAGGNHVNVTADADTNTVTIGVDLTDYNDATQTEHGLMSAADKTKLDGIAEGATANIGTVTEVRMNGESKGTSGVIDLGTVITEHQQLPTELPASDVYAWAKEPQKPTYTADEVGALANTVTHLVGDIATTEKGVANGVATLGTDGKVPIAQLPSYVDDVVEFAGMDKFPAEGESGKIYVDTNTNLTWRWSGSTYVEISQSVAIGTVTGTALDGKIGTDHINSKENPHNVTKEQVGLGNVENKSSADIRGELTKANVTDALGYTPAETDTTYDVATTERDGLLSAADKTKLDGIEDGANRTVVDSELSATSTNPVQNKVVDEAIKAVSAEVNAKPTVYIQNSQPTGLKAGDIWISF